MNFSELQLTIANSILSGNDVVIEGVAGSGKSSIINALFLLSPSLKVLHICKYVLSTKHSHGELYTMDGLLLQYQRESAPFLQREYDVLVIDDAQDITQSQGKELYKLLGELNFHALALIGDYRASMGDDRFLVCASHLFSKLPSKRNFKRYSMTSSYRLSPPMAGFLKYLMGNGSWEIEGANTLSAAEKIRFMILDRQLIREWVNRKIRHLKQKRVAVVSLNGEGNSPYSIIGKEYQVVFLIGFNEPLTHIPRSLLYSCLTRAKHRLYLIQIKGTPTFRGLKTECLKYCKMNIHPMPPFKENRYNTVPARILSERCFPLPPSLIKAVYSCMKVKYLGKGALIPLSRRVVIGSKAVDVSAVYGILIPILKSLPESERLNLTPHSLGLLVQNSQRSQKEPLSTYEWLDMKTLNLAVERLSFLTPSSRYEVFLSVSITVDGELYKVVGAADCIDRGVLWELKCVEEITEEHILQLGIYAAIEMLQGKRGNLYKIFNIINGELYELEMFHPLKFLSLLITRGMKPESLYSLLNSICLT